MAEYRPHQREGAQWALLAVREYGLAYLSWQERTGKTGAAICCVEKSKAKTILIVTKKKAMEGWMESLEMFPTVKSYTVINYESIHKIKAQFDFIILDEAHHAIASIGRPSKTWKAVAVHTKGKPILYLSATPYAETVGQLYHQFKLSKWTPWAKFRNYYDFHKAYGIPATIYTSYGPQPDRSKFRIEEVLDPISHLFSFKTRAEVGIEHEPTINVVIVPMYTQTKYLIKDWTTKRVLNFDSYKLVDGQPVKTSYEVLGDSDAKMRAVHYQLEGGTLKIDDKTSIFLTKHNEKVNYIKENYEEEKIAVMAHFIKERELLERELPKATILSSDGHAEGVDLHRVDKLIVYSMSFKTSKHTQRTARQANHNRKTPIEVDILVMGKPAVGKAVYDSVAIKKENFVKSSYERSIK